MAIMKNVHSFHIPVMGTSFTIDTPIKVARYGISSVISILDDALMEQMREYYCGQTGETYVPITKQEEDYRARRTTAYLNLIDRIVKKQFAEVKSSPFEAGSEITKYFELLAKSSPLKDVYNKMLETTDPKMKEELQKQLRDSMQTGSIDVNIMTKIDRPRERSDGTPLPPEDSDALSVLRGYAQSTLQSALIFSAGINQRLYNYVKEFKDFYADAAGFIKKKLILKVSDYRSSLIQGKVFAKKGLWVSEYRVESGLNCGGHAFATTGHLMGPILEEFKNRRNELITKLHEVYNHALELKNKTPFTKPHELKITAQGGIGTAKEDRFLYAYYNIDGTGWGTPFLLCPEATGVNEETLDKLASAGEGDIYLSDVSPLGVPFNNLRGSRSDAEKERRVQIGRPGSACPKGHLVSNTEFTEKPICTASRLYQKLKLEQLAAQGMTRSEYKKEHDKIVRKACICHDLGESIRIKYDIVTKGKRFPAICPGPNLAYFSQIVSLREIVEHIYGKRSILNAVYRPNMFIKELKIYVDYLVKEVKECAPVPTKRQLQYFNEFKTNLLNGIEYYRELFPKMLAETKEYQRKALEELQSLKEVLEVFVENNHPAFFPDGVQSA